MLSLEMKPLGFAFALPPRTAVYSRALSTFGLKLEAIHNPDLPIAEVICLSPLPVATMLQAAIALATVGFHVHDLLGNYDEEVSALAS